MYVMPWVLEAAEKLPRSWPLSWKLPRRCGWTIGNYPHRDGDQCTRGAPTGQNWRPYGITWLEMQRDDTLHLAVNPYATPWRPHAMPVSTVLVRE